MTRYSPPTVSEWYPKIWDALKFEIWDGTNDEFIQRTLNILQIMARKLDGATLNWTNLDTPFAKYVISASNECCERLHDSKQQHILGSGQILHAIASGTHFAFVLVVRNVLPKMFVIWQDLSSKEEKTPLLGVFNKILQASLFLRATVARTLSNPIQDPALLQYMQTCESRMATCLSTFQQRLVDDVYFSAMTEKDSGEAGVETPFRANTIQGLVHLMRLPNFIFDFEKGTLIESLNRLASDSSQKEGIHSEAVSALQQISVQDPAKGFVTSLFPASWDSFRNVSLQTKTKLLEKSTMHSSFWKHCCRFHALQLAKLTAFPARPHQILSTECLINFSQVS